MDNEYFTEMDRIGSDLCSCIRQNIEIVTTDVKEVVLELTGDNDGPAWHWIVKFLDDSYGYIEGGCDYTGWGCQDYGYLYRAESLAGALLLVGEAQRQVFQDMIAANEKVRPNNTGW